MLDARFEGDNWIVFLVELDASVFIELNVNLMVKDGERHILLRTRVVYDAR